VEGMGPKKKKSLVPVGCQLRSWVGREFILFFYFKKKRKFAHPCTE
jgi:hypothetical protein